MKIGIIGLPQTGKKTIFRLLTGADIAGADPEKIRAPLKGIIYVRDPRLDALAVIYSSKKKTPACIEAVLMPKIEGGYIKSGALFAHLNDADAICHIVRVFKDDNVYHAAGSLDAGRDIDSVNIELMLSDLLFIEKRLERIEKDSKKGGMDGEKERDLLVGFKEHLEKGLPLRSLAISAEGKKTISSYPFITFKPLLVVLNTGEDDIKKTALQEELAERFKNQAVRTIQIPAKTEDELAGLDSKEEKDAFLKELGIGEPAIDKLTRLLYEALGMISFFTCCGNEVRAWMIRRGSTALQAAGTVHSDMARGFIRAEAARYSDMAELGSEHKVKEAGRLMVKGRDYIVEDGDILNIRFNV